MKCQTPVFLIAKCNSSLWIAVNGNSNVAHRVLAVGWLDTGQSGPAAKRVWWRKCEPNFGGFQAVLPKVALDVSKLYWTCDHRSVRVLTSPMPVSSSKCEPPASLLIEIPVKCCSSTALSSDRRNIMNGDCGLRRRTSLREDVERGAGERDLHIWPPSEVLVETVPAVLLIHVNPKFNAACYGHSSASAVS